MKEHKLPFLVTSMLIGLIPLFVASATISMVAIYKMKSNLEEDVYLRLRAAATAVKEYFEWDINEDILAVDDASLGFIDSYLNQDIELTLFLQDVRFVTSIYKEDGERNIGTKSAEGIWESVSQEKDYYAAGTVIGGKQYYVCYIPVYNSSNEVVGMAFAGMPESIVGDNIAESVQSTAESMQNVGESILSIAESVVTTEKQAQEIETISSEAKDNLSLLIDANRQKKFKPL